MGHRNSFLVRIVDLVLSPAVIFAIRIYQRTLSAHLGRVCLYSPTCSHQGIAYVRRFGAIVGIALIRRRLSACNGQYSLRMDGTGAVEMVQESGRIVREERLNPRIANKIKGWQTF